jgi:hypothetical protein
MADMNIETTNFENYKADEYRNGNLEIWSKKQLRKHLTKVY